MTAPNPIKALTDEHRVILQVVDALRLIGNDIENGKPADVSMLKAAAEFFREFADVLHHGKEEAVLFPAMERKGVPESGCPLGALRSEHVKGRRLVAKLRDALERHVSGDSAATSELVAAINGICELYPNHIWKEDEMVFPMVDRLFDEADLRKLQSSFERAEDELGQNRARHLEFAADISKVAR